MEQMKEKEKNEEKKKFVSFEGVAIFFIIIGLVLIFFTFSTDFILFNGNFNVDLAVKYGAYVQGLIGTIFVLSSTLLFYSALKEQKESTKLQSEELGMQREELELQRKEIIETRQVLEAQLQTSKDQLNNDVFFKLLNNFDNAINKVKIEETTFIRGTINTQTIKFVGIEAVKKCAINFINSLNSFNETYAELNAEYYNIRYKNLQIEFDYIRSVNDNAFIHIFKLLNLMFNFISDNSNNYIQKAYFKTIIKYTVDDYIKFIIAIYYIYESNNDNYKDVWYLININEIIEKGDFKNFIKGEEYHISFINSIFSENILFPNQLVLNFEKL